MGAAAVLANGYESLHGAGDACATVLAGAVVAVAVFVKTLV